MTDTNASLKACPSWITDELLDQLITNTRPTGCRSQPLRCNHDPRQLSCDRK